MANDTGRRGGREARRQLGRRRWARPAAGTGRARRRPLPAAHASRYRHHPRAALDVLERLGMAQALPSCIEACTARGAYVNEHGRLSFPRALVEDVVAGAARRFPLYGQDPRHDLEPWGSKVHFGTAGAAVHMVDLKTREYRESLLAGPLRCRPDRRLARPHPLLPALARAARHGRRHGARPQHALRLHRRHHQACRHQLLPRATRSMPASRSCTWWPAARPHGGRGRSSACPAASSCRRCASPRTPAAASRSRLPAACRCCCCRPARPGATSPAALAGSVVQAMAEVLAGLCYVNALKPGAPAIFGTWPFVSDLRTGAMSGGSAEQALLDGRLRPDGPVLRSAHRRRLGHERLQAARRPVRGGEGLEPRAGRQRRRQPDLRGGRDAGEPAGLQP